jgi:hypothetical protein
VEDGKLDFGGKSSYAEVVGVPDADLVIGAPAIRTVSQDVTGSVIHKKGAKTGASSNGAPGGPTERALPSLVNRVHTRGLNPATLRAPAALA